VYVILNRVCVKALVNLEVSENLIFVRAVFAVGLQPLRKARLYLLVIGNRKTSIIQHKVLRVPLNIHTHHKKINLDYFKLATYDVILELL
jgi:hypothetical protein